MNTAPPTTVWSWPGGGQIAIFDPKSNQPPQRFPLKRTPLNLILASTVDFSGAKMVVDHIYDGTSTTVVAQDPKHTDYGTIQLVFTENPIALRQWIVTDNAGQRTTVILGEFDLEQKLRLSLFNIQAEMARRGL
ncbi:MAG: LolA family protein [Paracoccaceae bacterium]